MAQYTIELQDIYNNLGVEGMGLDKYPIFDEDYRNVLNNNIIKHYYFREIGVETVDKFIFFLNRKMQLIMPYYNQMYETTLIEINPLHTVNYSVTNKEDFTRTNDTNEVSGEKHLENDNTDTTSIFSENTSHDNVESVLNTSENTKSVVENNDQNTVVTENNNIENKNYHSDCPQTEILNGDLNSNLYLSTFDLERGDINNRSTTDNNETRNSETTDKINNNVTTNDNGVAETDNTTTVNTKRDINSENDIKRSINNEEDYIKNFVSTTIGNNSGKSESELIMMFRESIINIDQLIIDELNELFMGVF